MVFYILYGQNPSNKTSTKPAPNKSWPPPVLNRPIATIGAQHKSKSNGEGLTFLLSQVLTHFITFPALVLFQNSKTSIASERETERDGVSRACGRRCAEPLNESKSRSLHRPTQASKGIPTHLPRQRMYLNHLLLLSTSQTP